jgi:hypothetical protein
MPLSIHLYRIAVGGLGGVAAACVKYLSQHQEKVLSLLENDQMAKAMAIFYGLLILAAVLFFLGGLIGWVSNESNGLKLLALGISAPALFTTWTAKHEQVEGGQVDKVVVESRLGLIQSALAAESSAPLRLLSTAGDSHGFTVLDGIKEVLGWDAISPNYWVVAGSYLSRDVAEQRARSINEEDPTMKAFVGKQRPGNKYFPVIVGEFTNREEAEKLLARALDLESVAKAYLSPYADRKP